MIAGTITRRHPIAILQSAAPVVDRMWEKAKSDYLDACSVDIQFEFQFQFSSKTAAGGITGKPELFQ